MLIFGFLGIGSTIKGGIAGEISKGIKQGLKEADKDK